MLTYNDSTVKEVLSFPALTIRSFLQLVSKTRCHSEGAFVATEESLLSRLEILRFAQDDIFEMTYSFINIDC
jgi:hypothetical protein